MGDVHAERHNGQDSSMISRCGKSRAFVIKKTTISRYLHMTMAIKQNTSCTVQHLMLPLAQSKIPVKSAPTTLNILPYPQ